MEGKSSEIKSELPLLPQEIRSIILGYVGSTCAITLKLDDKQPNEYYILVPKLISALELDPSFSPNNQRYYSLSNNMNSLDLIRDRFPHLCCLVQKQFQKYYCIENHGEKRKYIKNENQDEVQYYSFHYYSFDGINDKGVFLITYYYPLRNPLTSNFYLGKMTKKHEEIYSDCLFLPGIDGNQAFDYESKNNPGKISTAALCKTENRCALIDDEKRVTIFDITDNEQNNTLQVSSNTTEVAPTAIKKVSFITPTTLLALSEKGKLFIVAADPGEPVQFFKQRFRKNDENKTPILFSHCAVDPCQPYQILLHSTENLCIYWDIKRQILGKIMEFSEPDPLDPHKKLYYQTKNLWFYNDKFARYSDSSYNFQIYSLHYSTTENQEIISQLVNFVSKVTVTPFEKKKKKPLPE